MEERQTQVQVGAGLQESRLNTDLINFLQTYGSYAIYALLVVVLGYMGYNWWQKKIEERLDKAYEELQASVTSASPEGLTRVAKDNEGQGAVPTLARLEAARLMLDGARLGLRPGADPAKAAPEDKLTEAQRKSMIDDASKLIAEAMGTSSNPSHVLLAQQLRWAKATAQIEANDIPGATATTKELIEAARAADFKDQVVKGERRLEALGKIASIPAIYKTADLPEAARPPAKPATITGTPDVSSLGPLPPGGMEIKDSQGNPVKMERITDPEMIKKLDAQRAAQKQAEAEKKAAEPGASSTPPAPAPAPSEPAPKPN